MCLSIHALGMINLDFADVKSVMSGMGHAMMGTGNSDVHCSLVEMSMPGDSTDHLHCVPYS